MPDDGISVSSSCYSSSGLHVDTDLFPLPLACLISIRVYLPLHLPLLYLAHKFHLLSLSTQSLGRSILISLSGDQVGARHCCVLFAATQSISLLV